MKATQATIRQRVEELLAIRLDGAQFWDLWQYAAEKQAAGEAPWAIPAGGKPISQRTLWRYIAQTDRLIAQSCREGRKKLLRRHLAQRRNLYAKCVSAGDYRAALAAADSEVKLLGLYDDELTRELAALRREVEGLKGARHGDGSGAAGVGGPPPGGGGPQGDGANAAAGPPEGGPRGPLPGGGDEAGPLADGLDALLG
jgi:hypothetical protein